MDREGENRYVFANLVSTFCYLSLEGELGQFLDRRGGEGLLRGHLHPTEDDDDDGEDDEHTASHVDEDLRIVISLLTHWQHREPSRVVSKPNRVPRQTSVLPSVLKSDIGQEEHL